MECMQEANLESTGSSRVTYRQRRKESHRLRIILYLIYPVLFCSICSSPASLARAAVPRQHSFLRGHIKENWDCAASFLRRQHRLCS